MAQRYWPYNKLKYESTIYNLNVIVCYSQSKIIFLEDACKINNYLFVKKDEELSCNIFIFET